jgi:flagellar basal body-associated protein FliL
MKPLIAILALLAAVLILIAAMCFVVWLVAKRDDQKRYNKTLTRKEFEQWNTQ